MIAFRGGINLKEYNIIRRNGFPSPAEGGASLWWTAQDVYSDAGITKIGVDGTPVYQYKDQIGTNHTNQTVLANRATYKTNILNGEPVVRGATTLIHYINTSTLTYNNFTMIFVGSFVGGSDSILGDGNNSFWFFANTTTMQVSLTVPGTVASLTFSAAQNLSEIAIWTLRRTADTLDIRKNGANPATAAAFTWVNNVTNFNLFMSRRTTLGNLAGDVADFAAWDSYLSDSDLREQEAYFSDLYAIPLV